MARRDLIVSFLSSVPSSLRGLYRDPPLLLQSPVAQRPNAGFLGGRPGYQQWLSKFRGPGGAVVPGMFRAAGGGPQDTIGRVCVMGFSNGCIGVDEVLRASDSQRIDAVIAVDGIHGAYTQSGGKRALSPAVYRRYLNHGAHVVNFNPHMDPNAPVMAITHSQIVPGRFPSTGETTGLIWRLVWDQAPEDVLTLECGFECAPVIYAGELADFVFDKKIVSGGNGKTYTWKGFADGWYDRRIANNFFVLGWGDNKGNGFTTRDPTGNADHLFQGQSVLPTLLEELTVRRWNADCGLVATSGDDPPRGCVPGSGMVYGDAPPDKRDYFPALPPSMPITPECPPVPEGHVRVGSPSDPCAVVVQPPVASDQPAPASGLGLRHLAAVAAGGAAGYFGARAWLKRR